MVSAWERDERKRLAELAFDEREQEVARRNEELEARVVALGSVLVEGVRRARAVDYDSRLVTVPELPSRTRVEQTPPPVLDTFMPAEPGPLARLIPGWERRHEQNRAIARDHFGAAARKWREDADARQAALDARATRIRKDRDLALLHNREMREIENAAVNGESDGVEDYVLFALQSSDYGFQVQVSARFLPRRHELLLEVLYPSADFVIPRVATWLHIKTRKVVESKPRTAADRNKLYRELIAQITLRTIYESLHADRYEHIHTVSYKGRVEGISPITGRAVKPTVVSLRTNRDEFLDRDFRRVDPVKLLKSLRANISDEPTELKPVPLVVEFEIDDPRLIEEEDIISRLDDRDNLMDLSYGEFESVIVNLFTKMGYDARQTVRSKDGGVDCIAIYRDPVGITKYVIQAKQWSQVVKVDAVRDLYGTMTHERAGKAVLVTTSRVSEGGWKWAEDKPMQIVEGGELLDLFAKWTDLRVTIVFPSK